MSQSICIAIIEQENKKGIQCDRPAKNNGYCGKHLLKGLLEISIQHGNKKCSTHRCLNTFKSISNKNIEYCSQCLENKDNKLKEYILCKWKERVCKFKANETGYCGKHKTRGILLDGLEDNKHLCDDGKRACKNIIITNKKKCEDCLEKERVREKDRYTVRKENKACTQCGKNINEMTVGIRNHEVQKCNECYEKTRKIEDERVRERNYSTERKNNPDNLYRKYIESACKRNIKFELSLDEFINIISKACNYCEYYSDIEVIGIDRIDSSVGYINNNIVPCCKKCNMMKGELSLNEFKEHVIKLSKLFLKEPSNIIVNSLNKGESYIRPSKIAEMYVRNKLNEFIKLCMKDNRSPILIEKLKELSNKTPKLSVNELKKYIKTILFADSRSTLLTETKERKRIPRKEIIGYLNLNNTKAIVEVYEKTFDKEDGLEEDFIELSKSWCDLPDSNKIKELERVLIKYQNKRAKTRNKSPQLE